jgi:arsenite methyltransferase
MNEDKIKKEVREGYAKIVKGNSGDSGCCCGPSCCGGASSAKVISKGVGYSDDEMNAVPQESNLGLGCGNPTALASLKPGETVVDLGSGAGFDCFLAANKVGQAGKVIGVDMTHEMIEKARENARKSGYQNVEFRLGEIENLPVADNGADIIISNCVINLVPNKSRVFAEAFRVLKPGGRVMISDIVLHKGLPDFIMNSIEAYVGCLSGAVLKTDYLAAMEKAGFRNITIMSEDAIPIEEMLNDPTVQTLIAKSGKSADFLNKEISGSVSSIKVSAIKP